MRLIVLTTCLFVFTNVFSQEITVYGDVIDADGDPAVNVSYFFKGRSDQVFKTGRDGKFSIQLKVGDFDTLKFGSIQFDKYNLYIGKRWQRKARKRNDSLYFKIEMPDRTWNILNVYPTTPDTVFGTQAYSVEDYEFVDKQHLLLLTYENNMRKGAVLRYVRGDDEIDHQYIPGDAVELQADFRGKIHLLCEERIFLVSIKEDKIFMDLENRDHYFKNVAPIIDTIDHFLYFSNFSDVYPAFEYFEYNMKDSAYYPLLTIKDTFMMELYRSEYKYVDVRTKLWAHNKQIETGIDKEIWVGATVFTNSLYYQPLYSPLFKKGKDSILIFDHYENKLYQYTPKLGFVDSTRISYHLEEKKSGWEQPLLQDQQNGKVYAMFQRSGYTYLSEIDGKKGVVKKSFKLHFKYVERIQIKGGKVYYIYRPFESIQKKYIYSERLF